MRRMTDPQIKAMIGTPFIHELGEGDTIEAIIVSFDPKVGFTALASGSLISTGGHDFSDLVDENNNLCVIGVDAGNYEFYELVSSYCREIRDTGKIDMDRRGGVGSPSCSF